MQRDQLESHIECATKNHLDLACGELRDTQEKLKQKMIHFDGLEERVNILHEQLDEKLNDIQHRHRNNVDFLQQQYQRRVSILQEQLEKKAKSCQTKLVQKINNVDLIQQEHQRRVNILQEQLEQKVKTCQTKPEQKIGMKCKIFLVCLVLGLMFLLGSVKKDQEDGFQKKLDQKDSVIKNLEGRVQSLHEKNMMLQMDPEESHIFIWKITNFENKLREGKNNRYVDSVSFYLYGYKLMVRLFPNGQDNGENTHLSIYIVVTKGEYDTILPWGFSKQVTFTLIDQQDDLNRRQNVVMGFTAHPNNKAFKKPVEGETRTGWGFPQFVSHSDLRTRRFIVEDTLFIKVQVDSSKAKR